MEVLFLFLLVNNQLYSQFYNAISVELNTKNLKAVTKIQKLVVVRSFYDVTLHIFGRKSQASSTFEFRSAYGSQPQVIKTNLEECCY